jgi:transcriptional regulator with XRE-family HTH domain
MPKRRPYSTWEEYAREVGHRLTRARQAAGLSQERVAHMAGIAAYTYQKFEKGESKPGTPLNPRLTTLVALAQVLDIELVELLPASAPDLTRGR